MYNGSMAKPRKAKTAKKTLHTEPRRKTRLIRPWEEMPEEDEEEEGEVGGMVIEKEDIQLIYNALREYNPTQDEVALHSALLCSFEEMLVVDYKEVPPDVN